MLTRSGSPRDGIVAEILRSVPAVSLVGGTDEIQRNTSSRVCLNSRKERCGPNYGNSILD